MSPGSAKFAEVGSAGSEIVMTATAPALTFLIPARRHGGDNDPACGAADDLCHPSLRVVDLLDEGQLRPRPFARLYP
jgi:hypothetical protein